MSDPLTVYAAIPEVAPCELGGKDGTPIIWQPTQTQTMAHAHLPDAEVEHDAISPPHYQRHPSGIECIQITEHMNFNLGNAVKYIWRAALKGRQVEDLKKARWYLDREIERIGAAHAH